VEEQRARPVKEILMMLCLRILCRVPVVVCLLCLGAESALSQVQQDRVLLIMSGLPIRDDPAYETIRKLGANPPVQTLNLTKTEAWSVLRDNVAAVKDAAARHGVDVSQLDADWEHVFRPGTAGTMANDIDEKQGAMMDQVRSSRATIGVAMVGMPRAAQVEYALTRNAGAPKAPIRMSLNDKLVVTLVRTDVTLKADMLIWRGSVEDTGEPAVLMWWPGVRMAGTVHYNGRIYSIKCIHGLLHAIVEMSENRMPPEHAPMPQRARADNASLRDDPLVRQGDASMLRSETAARPDVVVSRPIDPSASAKDIVINVIVAYTKKAASNYADIEHELIDLAIEETNQSFRKSDLAHIKLKLVNAYQTDYAEDGLYFDHVWRFADKGDGYMDEIHSLRDKYDADVAVLVVADPTGCGLATRVYADADEAFAVVNDQCAALMYSLAHEIGHLIGARHELTTDPVMTPFPYGHGYINGVKWRDIMSYKESCGGCPRMPIWSNPKITLNGDPAGTASENNARVIAEQAERVANFRASRRENRAYIAAPARREPGTSTADPR
jgi:hypothetical protein